MNSIEAENIRLREEVSQLRDKVIELQKEVIRLLEEREQVTPISRSAFKNWVILVDSPAKPDKK